jgi:hypothetical protein
MEPVPDTGSVARESSALLMKVSVAEVLAALFGCEGYLHGHALSCIDGERK